MPEQARQRIALLGPTYPHRGGIVQYGALLHRALETRHEVCSIGFRRLYPDRWFPGRSQFEAGDTRFDVGAARLLDPMSPLAWARAARHVRAFDPDVMVLQWWHPAFGPCYGTVSRWSRRAGRPRTVAICHNLAPHEPLPGARWLSGYALGSLDKVVVHGVGQLDAARALAPRAEVVACPHPRYDQFAGPPLTREYARERLSVAGEVVLFFGHVRAYKGLDLLLEAWPAVRDALDATLVIAGEFYEDRSQLEHQMERLRIADSVVIHDRYVPNDEVGAYFAACDVVVCPYRGGSQSGVVQLAYSFARPVVCTDVGALAEAIDPGNTGVVVAPGDPGALARGIIDCLAARERVDFESNIRAWQMRFDWRTLVEAIVDAP